MPDLIREMHVTPVDDAVVHDFGTDGNCVCGPAVEPVERADGSVGWVIIHHSLDNREASEDA